MQQKKREYAPKMDKKNKLTKTKSNALSSSDLKQNKIKIKNKTNN
jgi:hypothetical protein